MYDSERAQELIDQYSEVHRTKDYGRSSEMLIGVVQRHIYDLPKVERILDFGCGRSRLVDWIAKIHDAQAFRYDPAIPEFSTMPEGTFDLVTCTDVMEHIPEENIEGILKSIRSKSENAYLNISCRVAHQTLPNGENAHCTVRPHAWWVRQIRKHWSDVRRTQAFVKEDVGVVTWAKP